MFSPELALARSMSLNLNCIYNIPWWKKRPIWLTFESKNMKLMIHIICGLLVELLQLTDKTLNLKSNHITSFHFWVNNWFCILIIWVREVLTRTALGDIDWHFDSLSESWNLSHCQVVTVLFRETLSQTNRGDDQCCEIYNMNCLASGTVLLKKKTKKILCETQL